MRRPVVLQRDGAKVGAAVGGHPEKFHLNLRCRGCVVVPGTEILFADARYVNLPHAIERPALELFERIESAGARADVEVRQVEKNSNRRGVAQTAKRLRLRKRRSRHLEV